MAKKLLLCCAISLLALFSGCRSEGVIPPEDMEGLFADFYRADTTIELLNESDSPLEIDSMRVYLPIVEAYGYTKEEFRSSLEYYLHRPDRMVKIFERVRARLEQEADAPLVIDTEEADTEEMGRDDILDAGEGSEPAIEQQQELPKPQREQKKNRRKMTKEDLKRLEEELK